MYFRVNTQKNKDGSVRKYLLLSRTYRVDGKVRQETLCNLGRLEQLTEGGSVDSLIEGLAKFSERYLDRIHGQGSSNTVIVKDKGVRTGVPFQENMGKAWPRAAAPQADG